MSSNKTPEHFLDTSVGRPIMTGSSRYKRYFRLQFEDRTKYVSVYVSMEFRRSFIRTAIDFYDLLSWDTIETIGDALSYWSEKFRTRDHKAIIQFIAGIVDTQSVSLTEPLDLKKFRKAVGLRILNYDGLWRRTFTNIGHDSTHCARAVPTLEESAGDTEETFSRFIESFDNTTECRANCDIDNFFLQRFRPHVEEYIALAATIKRNHDTKGFRDIAENLKKIIDQGPNACSCKMCEKVGDAVIALDAPREMRLEHTDRSHNLLCEIIEQPHFKHPSHSEIIKPNP